MIPYTVANSMGRSSVQLFSQLQSSLPHKMLPKSPSLALSVPTLRCRCCALWFLMPCDARSLTQLRIPWGDQVCSCSRSCKVLCLTKCCQRVPVWLCLCPLCVAVASHFVS